MKLKFIFLIIGFIAFFNVKSQSDSSKYTLDEFEVTTYKVGEKSPVAHENISKEEIEVNNHGVDLPILLDQATSVVTTSDAGAGVGYTGIRVRGSDATRVNVTINGIPFNDAEGQGVYWVNMPDLSSSTDDIQIQRGVGASTTGASAFGASINLSTLSTINSNKPYGEISNSFGSFNTLKNTIRLGTGLIDGKWNFEGRLSKVVSDGFIYRASSDLNSYYLSGSYLGERTSIQALIFSGHEKTYQSWGGAPLRVLDTNQTYNPYAYGNQIDNYTQTHYQLHLTNKPTDKLKLNASLHYTRGFGYYESYKESELLSDYNLNNIVNIFPVDTVFHVDSVSPNQIDSIIYITDQDTLQISNSDIINRKWLDNHFYGIVYSAEYNADKFQLIVGGGANQYLGGHYGEVIWAQHASNGQIRHRYYDNDAVKNDINFYSKLNYNLNTNLSAYLDLQYRFIDYKLYGLEEGNVVVDDTINMSFFNPKFGFNYIANKNSSLYGFAGIGNKEPNRTDITESVNTPTHENMLDIEFGYRYSSSKLSLIANLYNMKYKNQLILTGDVNDVGSPIRINVPNSFRRGLELTAAIKLNEKFNLRFNTTLSQNKIVEFTEAIDDWDLEVQVNEYHENTDIAFSPSVIGGGQLIFTPFNSVDKGKLDLALVSKYVGEQYLDNTSSEYGKLEDYFVHDFRINYSFKTKLFKEVVLSSWVRNLLNQNYISNAWIYRFQAGSYATSDPYVNTENESAGRYNMIGAYNQAGINFFVGLKLRF
ncbi:MAG: TonB-dependent receptor [Crocinitomicaceae bacterium]|nr:TonB-dependent receptor [Crocinitomicaceae bacterium]